MVLAITDNGEGGLDSMSDWFGNLEEIRIKRAAQEYDLYKYDFEAAIKEVQLLSGDVIDGSWYTWIQLETMTKPDGWE